jgi:peptidoglycan/LPS O-acetylase OafA/YrhL
MVTLTSTTDMPLHNPRLNLVSTTGLRGILAYTVFFFHSAMVFVLDKDISDAIIRIDVGPGEAALSFFFILSGFILVWVAKPGEPKRRFWRRRVVKIFPNHLLTWTAGLILMISFGVFSSWGEVLPQAFLIQSWIPAAGVLEGTNGPSWSLSCEMFFYLLFPFLLTRFRRIPAQNLWRWVYAVCGAMFAVTLLVGLFVPEEPKAYDWGVPAAQFYLLIFFPLTRLLDFVLGMLLAFIVMRGLWRPVRQRWMWAWLAFGFVMSIVLPSPLGFVAPFIPGLVLMIGGAAMADISGRQSKILTNKWLVWMGDISFAFYLIHNLMLQYTERAIGEGPYPLQYALLFILGNWAVSIVLAYLVHTRVEMPAMRRWARPKRRPAPAATASSAAPVAEPAQQQ